MMDRNSAYAAYFNVARHNLFLALNHVAVKCGISEASNEDAVAGHPVIARLQGWALDEANQKLISDKDVRLLQKLVAGLKKSIPILADEFAQDISGQRISMSFHRPRPDPSAKRDELHVDKRPPKALRTFGAGDMHWALKLIADRLVVHRNFYSHAYQEPVQVDKQHVSLLGKWFDAARRSAKQRFAFTDDDVNHLLRIDKGTKKEDPRLPHAIVQTMRGTTQLSETGAAFMCCLFLEKQQASEFLKQLPAFKHEAPQAHQASLRTYTHFSIRLPFVRIETDNTPQSLALDILSEVARCPAEIFEFLSDDDKACYTIDPKVEASDLSWRGADCDREDDEELATRFIRHRNRFAPLMLDCFDHFASAGDDKSRKADDVGIRFQLDLGDFYFAAYDKRLPDGSVDVRRLKQKVLRFGLLSQARAQSLHKPHAWLALEASAKTAHAIAEPYIVKTQAHYHFNEEGGNLPVKLAAGCSAQLYAEPTRDPLRPQRYASLQTERPDFWLSPHELVSLSFYEHLRSSQNLSEAHFPKVGNLMRSYRSQLKRLYEAIGHDASAWQSANTQALTAKLNAHTVASSKSDFYELRLEDLPTDLQNLLLGQAKAPQVVMANAANNTLSLLIDDGIARQRALTRVKDGLNDRMKPGKVGYRVLRAGEMATFLASDMLRLQPEQDATSAHKGKPTSIMADLLQARLAYFGRDKTSLPALLNSLKLTGNAPSGRHHPFVHEIKVDAVGMNGIAQYYEAYLNKRQSHLRSLQTRLSQGQINLQSPELDWLNLAQVPLRLQDKQDLDTLLARYLKRLDDQSPVTYEPLNLPRGLFRALTCRALVELKIPKLTQTVEKLLDAESKRGLKTSVSQLVENYMHQKHGDQPQAFYFLKFDMQRRIDMMTGDKWAPAKWRDRAREVSREQDTTPKLSTNTNTQKQSLQQIETSLKSKMGKNAANYQADFDRAMRQRSAQDQVLFLAARQLLAQSSILNGVKLGTLKRDDLNQQIQHEMRLEGKTIYTNAIKAKNIGDFKRLGRDRRLPGLLHYFDSNRIHMSVIAHELQAYPRAQNTAFKAVLDFEKGNNPLKIQAGTQQAGGSLHRTLVEQRLGKAPALPADAERLATETLTLRNAFCHNQVPERATANHTAHALLAQSEQALVKSRQTADDISQIRGEQAVASHFATRLEDCYSELALVASTSALPPHRRGSP